MESEQIQGQGSLGQLEVPLLSTLGKSGFEVWEEGIWGACGTEGLKDNFASDLPDSLGTKGGVGVGKEVKPLGNPLSQAVGRRRHHRGSWAGQGQCFPTGCNRLLDSCGVYTPNRSHEAREKSLFPFFKDRTWQPGLSQGPDISAVRGHLSKTSAVSLFRVLSIGRPPCHVTGMDTQRIFQHTERLGPGISCPL